MIYDISQEILTCNVFKGDPKPIRNQINSIDNGDTYNLSTLEMCVHNGTHIDAPYHFINNGDSIEKVLLSSCVGDCYVYEFNGNVTKEVAEDIMTKAREHKAFQRILIKGNATITLEASKVFTSNNILLIGNESQSVGPLDNPLDVHVEFLSHKVVLLEGIVLKDVEEGVYFLSAAPLNISGSDGSPCRAYLLVY